MNNRVLRPQRKRPDAPRIVTADQSAGLSWTRPPSNGAAIMEYRVYAGGVFVAAVPADGTTWPGPLTLGQVYSVSAVNAAGEGARAGPVTAT
jgi:hypothetical protein